MHMVQRILDMVKVYLPRWRVAIETYMWVQIRKIVRRSGRESIPY
jgi:hypothetical protein